MLTSERRQVGYEEEIEEELDIRSLLVVLELRVAEEGLIMSLELRLI
jgi:hypothetical protein